MSALEDMVAASDPALAAHRAPHPGPGRFDSAVSDGDRAFVLEAIFEGYLLHYEEPRAFVGMDPDLRLLAGDALYALGLSRLAERGDLVAVAELADLIASCARAQAEGEPELVPELWSASTARLAGRSGSG